MAYNIRYPYINHDIFTFKKAFMQVSISRTNTHVYACTHAKHVNTHAHNLYYKLRSFKNIIMLS